MKVLVTGASGFLGSAVAAQLITAGHEVRTFQRRPSGVDGAQDSLGSLTSQAAVVSAVTGMDAVIHLAAKVSLAGNPDDFGAINVTGTRTLLRAARAAGVSRFVQVSSPSVAHAGRSIFGAGAQPADPARARGNYARTKAISEVLALESDAPGFAVVAVRPHIVWGPGDTQLIARVVERARAGRLPLLGSGAALIDTTYVDNAASALTAALDKCDVVHGNAYVVTNGEPRPIAEILTEICRAAGVSAPRWSVPAALARGAGGAIERAWRLTSGTDEPPMTRFLAEQMSTAHWFDLRRTRADLGWEPRISMREGYENLAAFYGTGDYSQQP